MLTVTVPVRAWLKNYHLGKNSRDISAISAAFCIFLHPKIIFSHIQYEKKYEGGIKNAICLFMGLGPDPMNQYHAGCNIYCISTKIKEMELNLDFVSFTLII